MIVIHEKDTKMSDMERMFKEAANLPNAFGARVLTEAAVEERWKHFEASLLESIVPVGYRSDEWAEALGFGSLPEGWADKLGEGYAKKVEDEGIVVPKAWQDAANAAAESWMAQTGEEASTMPLSLVDELERLILSEEKASNHEERKRAYSEQMLWFKRMRKAVAIELRHRTVANEAVANHAESDRHLAERLLWSIDNARDGDARVVRIPSFYLKEAADRLTAIHG